MTRTYQLSDKFGKSHISVQRRYLLSLVNKQPFGSFVYATGDQSSQHEIKIADSYDEAVEELAFWHNDTRENVIADYHNWYYIIPIDNYIDMVTEMA